MTYDEMDDKSNSELIELSKHLHGKLYHRINSLQVQVNRLREENKILNEKLGDRNSISNRVNVYNEGFEAGKAFVRGQITNLIKF